MTRARDELLLGHALDYGGKRTRRVSPFVLEALDLPAGTQPATRAADPLERLGSFEAPAVAEAVPPAARRDGPLVLSFNQVDAYLTCPLRYKYAHVLRVPTRAAPRDRVRVGAPRRRAGVPQAARARHRDERGRADRRLRAGVEHGGLRLPGARGGAPRGRPRRAQAVPPEPAGARRDHPGRGRARVRVHPGRRSRAGPDGPRGPDPARAGSRRRRSGRSSRLRGRRGPPTPPTWWSPRCRSCANAS